MSRDPIPTWCFAVVVVQRGHQFLLVHERKHGQRWYLPAGRVEPGETFVDAAYRETLEETGVAIRVDGVIRVEHSPLPGGQARMRILFHATPADDRPPRSAPNEHTLGAAWVSLDELSQLPLRGPDVEEVLRFVATKPEIAPCSILTPEGSPF